MTQKINWQELLDQAPEAEGLIVENKVWDVITNSHKSGSIETSRLVRAAFVWLISNSDKVEWFNLGVLDLVEEEDPMTELLHAIIEATPDDILVQLGAFIESFDADQYTLAFITTDKKVFEENGYELETELNWTKESGIEFDIIRDELEMEGPVQEDK